LIVLDSSFLVAFHNSSDVHHAAAKKAMRRLLEDEWGERLLPEYVFLEVVTVLAARRDAATALGTADLLLRARELEFVPASPHFLETYETFRTEAHRGLSFADASIVALCRLRGAEYIASFDSDFRRVPRLTVIPR